MAPRGRARKHNPTIPAHIDQASLPAGVYWDPSGKGRWYVFVDKGGRPGRETIAGPNARLSDLHRFIEEGKGGATEGSVAWVLEQFHSSSRFSELAPGTRKHYEAMQKVVTGLPTKIGIPFGQLMAARLTAPVIQRVHERIVKEGHPTKANHVLRYMRRTFKWAGPHLGLKENPAKGIEQAKERKRRRLPTPEVYDAVISYARDRGQRKAHTDGSVAPYLWIVAEIGYLCRLRGIETNTLVESQGDEEGLHTDRRKGSRNNVVQWSPRLRAAWDAALAYRGSIIRRRSQPEQLRAEHRFLFISQNGEPLSKSGLDSAWQRLIASAIEDQVITEDQRFSLHDLKRKGGTDTAGNSADKQDALGVTAPMMKVYDLSVPRVKPSDMP